MFQSIVVIIIIVVVGVVDANNQFQSFYRVEYGGQHATLTHNDTNIQLLLDQYSGAGFISTHRYRSGSFSVRMKLSKNTSGGVITTFFLSSKRLNEKGQEINHDEFDFEFFGNNDKPRLNTNIFANDSGNREQSFRLWFDPSEHFHSYKITWNPTLTIFFVDEVPIRVFRNYNNLGLYYPNSVMTNEASIWHASFGGPTDFSKGPFTAQYEDFLILGCTDDQDRQKCANPNIYKWNTITKLTPEQKAKYKKVRNAYMVYDYCNTKYKKKECDLPIY